MKGQNSLYHEAETTNLKVFVNKNATILEEEIINYGKSSLILLKLKLPPQGNIIYVAGVYASPNSEEAEQKLQV